MIKGGMNTGAQSASIHGIKPNSVTRGKTVNLIFGLTLSSTDLIWYNDWKTHSSPVNTRIAAITGQTGNKKAGKKGSMKYYSAAIDLLLGHAPLAGILAAWQNNVKLGVQKNSVSGIVTNGQFSFTPAGGAAALIAISGRVPTVGPYTIQTNYFIADSRVRIDSTSNDNLYLQRTDPTSPPGPMQYTVSSSGLYTFNAAQAGAPLRMSYYHSGGFSTPTIDGYISATPPYVNTMAVPSFLASDDDISSGAIRLVDSNTRIPRYAPPGPPPPGYYIVDPVTGLYTFNAAQANQPIRVTYYEFQAGGTASPLAGVYAVTVHENYSVTFNDYGAPASVTQTGTWERPLWNATFGVPGQFDVPNSGRLRDPYTWWYDGINPVINFPPALEGMPVTVYYAVPVIFKTDGTFYSSQYLPLQILNLEFERVLGSGSEYTNFPDQQIIQTWVSGVSSVEFDLGTANALPNLNFEVIGAFTIWPNGDCDVADIITDIAYSGPVIVDTGY